MPGIEVPPSVETFLRELGSGPRALLVQGEPGIGKTTLAGAVAARAQQAGFTVVPLHVGRPETAMSFAALGDLLEAMPDAVLDQLPAPQRDALAITMLRAPGDDVRQDPRAVALATLAAVRQLASESPVLLVVDDLQWLDVSSARVFSFLLQRLETEPVGLLGTVRTGDDRPGPLDVGRDLPGDLVEHFVLGPMAPAPFGRVLRARVAPDLPRSVVLHIHAAVDGNPFFGLELAREVVRHGLPDPGAPLPLPQDALAVVQQRLVTLSADTRAVLMTAALTSRPTVGLLGRAQAGLDVAAALVEAETEDLVTISAGRISFTHAIFASALLAQTSAPERRRAHRQLADASESPEERARHLALSSLEPEAAIADALAVAQVAARRRGATTAAAELAALAAAFTPEEQTTVKIERALEAGMLSFEAGDALSGQEALRGLVAEMSPGPERAAVMVTLCEICWQDTVEIESLSTAALAEPGAGQATVAAAHQMLAWVAVYRGRLTEAQDHVDRAAAIVEAHDPDPAARADLLTVGALTAFLTGRPHHAMIEEAVRWEEAVTSRAGQTTTIYSGARVTRALIALLSGELDTARGHLEEELDRLQAMGRYVARDEILCYLAHVACRTGAWADAERFAEECLEIGVESGHQLGRGQNSIPRAWLAAVRGDLDGARAEAEEALRLSTRYRDELSAATARRVLGLVAISAGDVTTAVEHLRHLVRFLDDSGGCWPLLAPGVADAVEALVAAGLLDEARSVVGNDLLTCRVDPWRRQAVMVARGEAALLAGCGDLDGAASLLESALTDPALAEQPFELGRTLLKAGEVERRRRGRSRARAHLQRAVECFAELGAPVWLEQARSELARLDGTVNGHAGLSPTETELVRLVASGLKNRELAGTMFVSVKTVEANLSHIYRKTGLRSRQELVRWWLTEAESRR